MIRIEKEKIIIEIDHLENYEHEFIEDLQFDLIQLMNCVHILKVVHEPDLIVNSSLLSIALLQRALMPSVCQMKQIYPFPGTDPNQTENEEETI
ncbi:hypothetical protein [Pedobacter caeni]|uniref:Uncharacterized protein n=1 Tax=Pedobacter caeni TaxID=288992 RepID=A0A1M4UIH0_9SPHI|nr:hypothetical protein [Pedobacter caeni]SHE56465.1 hypothetical protein SAMN04488522_101573 [Pedobacter caeni]